MDNSDLVTFRRQSGQPAVNPKLNFLEFVAIVDTMFWVRVRVRVRVGVRVGVRVRVRVRVRDRHKSMFYSLKQS